MKYLIITLFIFSFLIAGCDQKTEQAGEEVTQETKGTEMLKEKIAKFAPTALVDSQLLQNPEPSIQFLSYCFLNKPGRGKVHP